MSFVLKWTTLIEPIFSRVIAIIPHIREILNIAFKPFNGLDDLAPHDEVQLRTKIQFIDEKFKYISNESTGTISLKAVDRARIIIRYQRQLHLLQSRMLEEMIKPLFEEMSNSLESLGNLETNPFVIFYQEEMEHSLLLNEKEFSMDPIKKSILRTLEEGFDYLMKMHPRRTGPGLFIIDRYHEFGRNKQSRKYSLEYLNNSSFLDLIGLINFTWNSLDIRKDVFLSQFSENGIPCTYLLAFPEGRYSIFKENGNKPQVLEDLLDKLIIEVSMMLRLWTTSTLLDKHTLSYMYPRRPIEAEVARIRKIEKSFTNMFNH